MTDRDSMLDALLDDWAQSPLHEGEPFIRDGIIDPELWDLAPVRVLFVLREADAVGETWDLRKVIREDWRGPKYKVWWTAAAWAYAAHRSTPVRVPAYPASDREWQDASDSLLASASINLKKTPGGSTSNLDEIATYAAADSELIQRQIELINPDVVVCGGVWRLISPHWPTASRVCDLVYRQGHATFVDFWHPANHFPNHLNYYALAALLQLAGVGRRVSP